MVCEDYPCCGHASGDCPSDFSQFHKSDADDFLPYPCIGCGERISKRGPRATNSSFCANCKNKVGDEEFEARMDAQAEYDEVWR